MINVKLSKKKIVTFFSEWHTPKIWRTLKSTLGLGLLLKIISPFTLQLPSISTITYLYSTCGQPLINT